MIRKEFDILIRTISEAKSANGRVAYANIRFDDSRVYFTRKGTTKEESIVLDKLWKVYKAEEAINTKTKYKLSRFQAPALAIFIRSGCYSIDKEDKTHSRLDDGLENKKQEWIHEFTAEGLLYRASIEQLSKHFISKLLNVQAFGMSFSEVKGLYSATIDEAVPAAETEFYEYIFKQEFGYDKEPRRELLNSFRIATDHLKEIDERVDKITNEIVRLDKGKHVKERQEKNALYHHYLKLNNEARVDLLEFLKNRIYLYTLNQCDAGYMRGVFSFGQYRYRYELNPKAYKVKMPSFISNKFGEQTIQEGKRIAGLFKNDKEEFKKFIDEYIVTQGIVFQIVDAVKRHHVFEKKLDVFDEALQAYQDGKHISFACTAVVLIEGIFHEMCLLLGIDENTLLETGFGGKVEFLSEKLGHEFDYAYYKFRFRLLRNKIAHGLFHGEEITELSSLILLDLSDAAEFTHTMSLDINFRRFLLHETLTNTTNERFLYLAGYFFMESTEIPGFYKLQKDHQKAKRMFRTNAFWNFIDNKISKGGETKNLACAILKSVMELNLPSLKPKCIKIFKTIHGTSKINKEEFLNSLKGIDV